MTSCSPGSLTSPYNPVLGFHKIRIGLDPRSPLAHSFNDMVAAVYQRSRQAQLLCVLSHVDCRKYIWDE